MDSLTHIVLGAAVGNVCLGKKLGNRAMLWGAIAGTIPDFDVISNLWMSELDSLRFHRGITHSLLFISLLPFLLAWLVGRFYQSDLPANAIFRKVSALAGSIFVGLVAFVLIFIATTIAGFSFWGIVFTALFAGLGLWFIYRLWKNYGLQQRVDIENVSYGSWYNFFFWTLLCHPICDCFTVFGTQILTPFSDQRVSWDNIAVADPAYTFPFAIFIIWAAFYHRSDRRRAIISWIGIAISCAYLLFTFYNKQRVEKVLLATMESQGIVSNKYLTTPTILNNALWAGTIKTDSFIYQGQYSLFDKEKTFKLVKYPIQVSLLDGVENTDHTVKVLRWFCKDYFTVIRRADGHIQLNDMRYGTFENEHQNEDSYIFNFVLNKKNGNFELLKGKGGPKDGDEKNMIFSLWNRIKGI